MVALTAVARYHFTDKAGKEKLEAEKHGYESQIKERLFCDRAKDKSMCLLDELLDYYPDGGESSGKEHEDACETEEMHRLLAETAEEPQGYKVEQTVYETL